MDRSVFKKYDKSNIIIAVLGSHSALDVCRGAKDLGFKSLVITQKGRGKTYDTYFRTKENLGCIDEVLELENFKDLLKDEIQKKLVEKNVIFVPHRSFEVYINDYDAIENKFNIPMFGNRKLLKIEERNVRPNQYDLMDKAGIRYPKQFKNPKDIDGLVIVKVLERERGFERAFFFADSPESYEIESARLIEQGHFTKEALEKAVIEEFITGVQVNFNYFYDPINERLELIGTDTRRQTNIEGILKLTGSMQEKLLVNTHTEIKYEEAGHIAVTVLESMLEQAFELGEKFVKASKEMHSPGIIGPFGLQTMIIPGPPKKEIIVFDISPRMPGSPGIFATPYSGYLYGQNISMGKRVAMGIKAAIKLHKLEKILT